MSTTELPPEFIGRVIEPRLDLRSGHYHYPSGVTVPMLEAAVASRQLQRELFAERYQCSSCASTLLMIEEFCGRCGGIDLAESQLIYHLTCASVFSLDEHSTCPRCQVTVDLHHEDFEKAGRACTCRACHVCQAEPEVRLLCAVCGQLHITDDIGRIRLYRYRPANMSTAVGHD